MKVLNCLRLLTSECTPDGLDDGNYMAEETGRQYFRQLCRDLEEMYGERYLRRWHVESELEDIEAKYCKSKLDLQDVPVLWIA